MELSTREDINAPIDWVWERVTDYAAFEKIALRRGAEVQRKSADQGFAEGSSWIFSFRFRGRDRELEARIVSVDAPQSWSAVTSSSGIDGDFTVELVEMSKTRTRIIVETRLTARTLSSRLMLQSLKLAKSNLLRRFRERISGFAADLEERYASAS